MSNQITVGLKIIKHKMTIMYRMTPLIRVCLKYIVALTVTIFLCNPFGYLFSQEPPHFGKRNNSITEQAEDQILSLFLVMIRVGGI